MTRFAHNPTSPHCRECGREVRSERDRIDMVLDWNGRCPDCQKIAARRRVKRTLSVVEGE